MNVESRVCLSKASELVLANDLSHLSAPSFVDLFCGGGLVRLGLNHRWSCELAVDWDETKEQAYKSLWGDEAFERADVSQVSGAKIKAGIDLVWASFPCQDLSLAGTRRGLSGSRSGYFWSVIELIRKAKSRGAKPKILAFENVPGFVSQKGGDEFASAIRAITELGYACTAVVLDAKHFVPQSRPRVFILGVDSHELGRSGVTDDAPNWLYPNYLLRALSASGLNESPDWFWLASDLPPMRSLSLTELMDWQAEETLWDDEKQTRALLSLLSPLHRSKLEAVISSGQRKVLGVYRRMRPTEGGKNIQRAEISFNDHAGCLRAPTGGSSRQKFLFVEGKAIKSRLPSPSELCAIMGVQTEKFAGLSYNQIYRVFGEGVCPPVVKYLDDIFFKKIL